MPFISLSPSVLSSLSLSAQYPVVVTSTDRAKAQISVFPLPRHLTLGSSLGLDFLSFIGLIVKPTSLTLRMEETHQIRIDATFSVRTSPPSLLQIASLLPPRTAPHPWLFASTAHSTVLCTISPAPLGCQLFSLLCNERTGIPFFNSIPIPAFPRYPCV